MYFCILGDLNISFISPCDPSHLKSHDHFCVPMCIIQGWRWVTVYASDHSFFTVAKLPVFLSLASKERKRGMHYLCPHYTLPVQRVVGWRGQNAHLPKQTKLLAPALLMHLSHIWRQCCMFSFRWAVKLRLLFYHYEQGFQVVVRMTPLQTAKMTIGAGFIKWHWSWNYAGTHYRI